MPAKHVRFASTNTLYSLTSPPAAIPWKQTFTKIRRSSFSNVPSSSSSSSSAGPSSTQSQPIPLPQPTTRPRRSSSSSSSGTPLNMPVPFPIPVASSSTSSKSTSRKSSTHHFQLHYLLAYSPFQNTAIKYDLSIHPSMVADHYPGSSLLEPATNPSVPSLTITSPYLRWPIYVTPSPFLNTPYVTVVDVLNSLYHDLRSAVRKEEYDNLSSNDRPNVDAAYWGRCGQVREELKKGVKRVDFLMSRNRFMGLSGTRKHPSIWELNVSTWVGD